MEPGTTGEQEQSIMSSRQFGLTHAFTLIELLVVIAILAILAAILFPVFARAKMAAFKTQDLAQIKQVGVAQTLYTEDFDEHFLAFPRAGSSTNPAYVNGEKGPFWSDRQMPYIKSQQIYSGPVNQAKTYSLAGYFTPGNSTPAQPEKYRVTYALNPAITRAWKFPDQSGAAATTSLDDPSKVTLVGHSLSAWPFLACQELPAGSGITHYVWMYSQAGSGWGYELWGAKDEKGGFDGGINFGYADLHAKFQRTVDVGTAPGDKYPLKSRSLFRGVFRDAIAKENVGTDGTCPADRGANTY